MISAMGNKYTPIGQAEVDKVRNAGDINSVLMTGYENNIANLSNTYDHAQYQLDNKVRELIAQLSFKDPTRNAAIQQQIQNLQRSWDPQAGTFSGYDPKLNPTADYLSGARLPQGNFFGSVLNDDTSTYRSAPKGAMTLPTATKMGSQARLRSGTSGGSSAAKSGGMDRYISPLWNVTDRPNEGYSIPVAQILSGTYKVPRPANGTVYADPSGRKTWDGKLLPGEAYGVALPQFVLGGGEVADEESSDNQTLTRFDWGRRFGTRSLADWAGTDPSKVNLADLDPDLAKLPVDIQNAIKADWNNFLLNTGAGGNAVLQPGVADKYTPGDPLWVDPLHGYMPDGYTLVTHGRQDKRGGDVIKTAGGDRWGSLEGAQYIPGVGLALPSRNFVPDEDSFMDKLVPAAILALGTAGIGSGIAGAAGAGQAVGGAIAGGLAGGIHAKMNDTNLLAGIGRGALFGGLGGAAKGAFLGDGGLGSAGGGGGGGGGGDLGDLGDLGGGLSLNSSGTGLQYPTFDPTTQLPDTLGSGVTTPDSFFPTFDAETLNLPEFLTSQTGYGLNPNTAGTGLRPPTTPGLGTMGNAQGLTLDVPDGTLSQAGFVPSGSSLYAPTNLQYDEANYISNPFTANPDPVVSNPGPEQSTLDKLTNGYKSLPPGLQSTIERLGAPLVTNIIKTILGGGGGGDTTGLEVGTTPGYNTDPGTGLEPGDLSAYLPYGIGWRGMKGDKAKKYSKRKAGATASPNFEEDRYGVMKIGQKRVRAQKQSTKPGRTYG